MALFMERSLTLSLRISQCLEVLSQKLSLRRFARSWTRPPSLELLALDSMTQVVLVFRREWSL